MAKLAIQMTPKFTALSNGNLRTEIDIPGTRPSDISIRCDGRSVAVTRKGENPIKVNLPKRVEPESAFAEYVFGRLFINVAPRKVKPFVINMDVATE